jgi:hypothetical protein
METRESQTIQAAIEAQDYRGFLRGVFLASSKNGKPNYSALSRRAGFSSRGFIPDVLEGRRRLTGNSFPKMLRLVGGPSAVRGAFTCLVQLEEPELNPDQVSERDLRLRLNDMRGKLRARLQATGSSEPGFAKSLFKSHHILAVYAALGDREPGMSVEEVARRSSVNLMICGQVVEHLHKQGVIREKNGLFVAANPHLIFEGLGEDHGFKASYLESVNELRRKASERFNAHDQLFCQSFFSVDRKRLPELKKRLREVVHEFVEAEADDGDAVARVLVGLWS